MKKSFQEPLKKSFQEPLLDCLIRIEITRECWENTYTFKARFYLKLVSFLFPGFVKLVIKD